jgi:ankyrin repeat protein
MLSLNDPISEEINLHANSIAQVLQLSLANAQELVISQSLGVTLKLPPSTGLSRSDEKTKTPLAFLIAGSLFSLAVVTASGYVTYQYAMRERASTAIVTAGFELGPNGLIRAISGRHLELIPAYARLGFSLSATPRVIEAAFISGSSAVVDAVLAGGATLAHEPNLGSFLQFAVDSDDPAVVEALIGLQPLSSNDVLPQIRHVIESGKWKAFERLALEDVYLSFESKNGETIAHVAGLSDSASLIQALQLSGRVDWTARNAQGQTALHFAVHNDKATAAAALVALGLDPLQEDSEGRTPLMIAWEKGRDSVIAAITNGSKVALEQLLKSDFSAVFRSDAVLTARTLIAGGIQLDAVQPNGHTPLFDAVQSSRLEMATLLLGAGASADAISDMRDVQGVTPLMMASANGHIPLIKLLLERGATTTIRASNGATALSIAKGRGRDDVVSLLGSTVN